MLYHTKFKILMPFYEQTNLLNCDFILFFVNVYFISLAKSMHLSN